MKDRDIKRLFKKTLGSISREKTSELGIKLEELVNYLDNRRHIDYSIGKLIPVDEECFLSLYKDRALFSVKKKREEYVIFDIKVDSSGNYKSLTNLYATTGQGIRLERRFNYKMGIFDGGRADGLLWTLLHTLNERKLD